MYYNYHKHDHKGNVRALDCVTKLEDYCKRAKELGHTAIFTTNHGMQGDLFEATTLAHEYNLKLIVGSECYYVNNRHEKDRSNKHIIIIALNNDGVYQLNKMLTIANKDGYYYKPRIDYELLMNLNPKNFVITTACVAGILKMHDLVIELHNKFKDNFFIEVQNHNENIQKEFNKLALKYNSKYGIKLIHGNDSHYIIPEDSRYRDLFLKAKGIVYEEESNFILDYPDEETIIKRYKKQNILNDDQIKNAINNTLIFDKAENITFINTEIKLPKISKNPNKELKNIIVKEWKKKRIDIENKKHKDYKKAILYETDIISKTHMENYFILDYKIAQLAQSPKYNGVLTNTGRGSAPSFYINNLLNLTNLDRLNSPCTLFPTRFMSVERIIGARSLPDIDLNTSDREPFIEATKEILGEENCAWMIAWKPLQEASGFRLFCKALGMQISEYDEIAKDLDSYKEDEKWKDIIKESKHFIGVVESMSESPCSMVLYDKPIDENIGMIRIKDKMYAMLDGYNCDKYKYLKNDYLQVQVWAIIRDVCKMAGIKIPSIKELNDLIDDKVWDIYSKGLTCSINQADSDWATSLVKKYKPKSVSEMSQWIAMIRPGCASLLNDFLDRKDYTTGVKELDGLLEDSGHRMIYQESIMKYLIWLGIDEPQSYDIIKKIAKKKFKQKELDELKIKLKKGWLKKVGKIDGFEKTWIVVQQASKYSFNASHSLSYAYDSIYGAYLKSHYPLEYYSVALNLYKNDEDRTKKLTKELDYFNIKINPPTFRYSNSSYTPDKNTNSIYKGLHSIKYLNKECSEDLYKLRDNKYNTFVDLLYDIKDKVRIDTRQMIILIKLDFFREFGKSKKLLILYDYFNNLADKKQIKKDNLEKLKLTENIVSKFANKITAKTFMEIDMKNMFKLLESKIPNKSISLKDKVETELEYLGYIDIKVDTKKPLYYVLELKEYKNKHSSTYYPLLHNLKTGEDIKYKIKKYINYIENPFKEKCIISINKENKENKKHKRKDENGNDVFDSKGKQIWDITPNEFNNILESWTVY